MRIIPNQRFESTVLIQPHNYPAVFQIMFFIDADHFLQFPGGSFVIFQVNRDQTLSFVAVEEKPLGDFDDGELHFEGIYIPGSILTFKVDEEGNLKLQGIVSAG